MKKLFVSLMTALLIGTSFSTFAAPLNDVLPLDASVIVWSETMKLDVVTQANEESLVVIRLRDANGHTLLTKYISKGETAIRSRFDLSNLEDGNYRVEIRNGSSIQVKEFTIQTKIPTPGYLRSISLS